MGKMDKAALLDMADKVQSELDSLKKQLNDASDTKVSDLYDFFSSLEEDTDDASKHLDTLRDAIDQLEDEASE